MKENEKELSFEDIIGNDPSEKALYAKNEDINQRIIEETEKTENYSEPTVEPKENDNDGSEEGLETTNNVEESDQGLSKMEEDAVVEDKPVINTKGDQKEEVSIKGYNFSKDFVRIISLTVAGIFLALSVFIMFKSFVPAKKQDQLMLSYSIGTDAIWSINLLPNNFYETSSLGVGEIVPVTFIDNIDINFSGFLSANQQLNLNYNYYITAEIITKAADGGNESNGNKLWTKTFRLVDTKSFENVSSTGYSISENVRINYQEYNELINAYKLKASIPMDAFLNVSLKISANSPESNFNENTVSSVSIPLSVPTVAISSNKLAQESRNIINTLEIAASTNYILLIFSLVVGIISAVVLVKQLKGLRKMTEEHSILLKFNKIMRDYSQIIIEIEELPPVENAAIITVKSFKDILDVQKELHLPILCERAKTEDLSDNKFYVVNQNQIFKYNLNDDADKF